MSLVLLGRLRQMMDVDACVLYLIGPSGDKLIAAGVAGTVPEGFLGTPIDFGTRIAGWVAANRTPVRNSDPELDMGAAAKSVGLQSTMVCPLMADDALRGAIGLYSRALDGFSSEHQRLVEILAPQLGEFVAHLSQSARVIRTSLAGHGIAGWFELREMFAKPRSSTEAWFPITVVTITCLEGPIPDPLVLEAIHTIRAGIRLGDCVFRLTESVIAVLLLRSTEEAGAAIVERLRISVDNKLARHGLRFVVGARAVEQVDEHIDDVIRSVQTASLSQTRSQNSIH
jgi:putative methionine-R-sulfoxide reductase with GAF domain